MKALDSAKARLRSGRARWGWLDHTVRAYDRNGEVNGGQLAGAITYFGFLSFFPLLALAFSVVGYVAVVYPDARDGITSAIQGAFPSLVGSGKGQINIDKIASAKAGAGIGGLLGLLYAGLGWLDSLRDALRRVFGTSDEPLSFLRKKLVDLLVLVLLGVALLASLVVTSLATAGTEAALQIVGLEGSTPALLLLKVFSVAVALAVDTVLFAILLSRLSGAHLPWRRVRSGAVFTAVGFEILKLLGTFLIGRTTANPLYATFGVVVGLLVWINFVSKLLLYAAAFTATAPYSLEPVVEGDEPAGLGGGIASGTEPVPVVLPSGYDPVSAASGDAPGIGRPAGSTLTVRGAVLGAAAGAGLAGLVTRRRSRAGSRS